MWLRKLIANRACPRSFGRDIHAAAFLVELNLSIHEREQRPIAACADILAGFELGAALTDNNAASSNKFTAIALHAQALADAVTSVADAALTFLVCHKTLLNVDFFDFDHGQFLTMTDGFVIAFATFHFEGDLLLASNVLDNIGHDGGVGNRGGTDGDFAVVVDEEHPVKRDRLPGLNCQPFDLQSIAFG